MNKEKPIQHHRHLWSRSLIALLVLLIPGKSLYAQYLSVEGFGSAIQQSPTVTNGAWYPDRYAPALFESGTFNGRSVLHQQISSAQAVANRPTARKTSFYNTHGRTYNLGSGVTILTGSLYIPAAWDTMHRRADIWAKAYGPASATAPTLYPIIGFANTEGNNPVLRYYLPDGTWANITSSINYDSWYTFRMEIKDTIVKYYVNNNFVGAHSAAGSTYLGSVIVQGYNFADPALPVAEQDFVHTDYDIYWDNIGGITNIHNVTVDSWHTSVQQAVSASSSGDVIEVASGTYTGNVIVDKSITINGPNSGVAGNATRADEAVVLNSTWTLGSANSTVSGFTFLNTVVAENQKAIAITSTGDVVVSNNIISREAPGSTGSWGSLRGIEMSAKTAGSTTIANNLFTGDGSNIYQNSGWRTAIWSNGGNGISYLNNEFRNNRTAINLDNFSTGQTLTGNTFGSSNGTHLSFGGTSATNGQYTISGNEFGILDVSRTTFNLSNVATTFSIDASGNTFNGIAPSAMTDVQKFEVEASLYHRGRSGRNGVVNYISGQQIVVPFNPAIQKALDAAAAGHTVLVAPGTYNEDVVISKAGQTLRGTDAATTILKGLYTGSAHTLQIAAANVTVKMLTVTRDYGTDIAGWNAAGKNQGITINQNVSGTVLDSLIVTGNRNGIYGQIIPNTTITHSLVENNRTGIHFGRNVSGSIVENNIIRNNFTHGIVYNADFGAVVNIANVKVRQNAIYGNWYSGINYQNNTHQTIAPTDVQGYDAACNWFGSATAPTVVAAAVSEPGYTAQVPSQFGGSNPGGANDITGLEAYRIAPASFANAGTEAGSAYTASGCTNITFPVMNITRNKGYYNIQPAISDAGTLSGDTITVAAGTYQEELIVNKPLTLLGPNAGINPNTGTRVPEAVIVPVTPGGIAALRIVDVKASNITIDGFTVDGDNTAITSGFQGTNGADIDAYEGIAAYTDNVNNLKIRNNIIRNVSYQAVTIFGGTLSAPATSGHLVSNNLIKNLGTYDVASGIDSWGGGVLIYNGQYTRVENNVIDSARVGIQTGNFHRANPGSATYQVITGNIIKTRRRGIFHNLQSTNASPYTLSNNELYAVATPGPETLWGAILLGSLTTNSTLENNSIDGAASNLATEGYNIWNVGAATPARIIGGSIKNVGTGIFVNNYDGYSTNAGSGAHANISGISIEADSIGIRVLDNPLSAHARVALRIDTGVVINGGQNGLVIENDSARVTSLSNISFTNIAANYIKLINNKQNLLATTAIFDVPVPNTVASSLSYADAQIIEAKITDKDDNNALGQVYLKTPVVNVTKEIASSPTQFRYATIQAAIDAASPGDSLTAAAWEYHEDVNIHKAGLRLVGAGATVTLIKGLYAGSGHTVAITQNNVWVEGFTVTRDFGTDTASWFASTKGQGIGLGNNVSGTTINKMILKGNRNGFYGQNAPNTTITNSLIEDNRTGIHFGRDVSGSVIKNNIIRNNFTHGILFNADFGAEVVVTNMQIAENAIYGNWYSGINYQNNSNQTLSPSSFTGYSATCNWFGSSAQPTVTAANPGEPGYTVQVPSQFGGTNPGGAIDVTGLGATLIAPVSYAVTGTESGTSYSVGSCIDLVAYTRLLDCGNYNFLKTDSLTADVVAGATSYGFAISNTAGTLLTTLLSSDHKAAIALIPGIQPGDTVSVKVRAQVNGTWGDYGFECTVGLSSLLTQLDTASCGKTNLSRTGVINTLPVANATQYEFRIATLTNTLIKTITSATNTIALNDTVFVPGASFHVTVRSMAGGVYGNYGAICTIGIANPHTAIDAAFCGQANIFGVDSVYAVPVANATAYEFRISSLAGSVITTVVSADNHLALSPSVFVPGTPRRVSVRVAIAGIYGSYGDSCVVGLAKTTTSLDLVSCGRQNYLITDQITVATLPVADDYQLSFYNAATNAFVSTITSAPSGSVAVSSVSGLVKGSTYKVVVRASVNANWLSVYGDTCLIRIADPKTKPLTCGGSLNSTGSLTADSARDIAGGYAATRYKFSFRLYAAPYTAYESVSYESTTPALAGTAFASLFTGANYYIKVRALVAGEWTPVKDSCLVTLARGSRNKPGSGEDQVTETSSEPGAGNVLRTTGRDFTIAPNPVSDVLNVTGDFKANAALVVQSLDGRVLLRKEADGSNSGQQFINVAQLPAGYYLLGIYNNGQVTYKRFTRN